MKKILFTLILSIAAPLLFGGNSTLSSYLLIDAFPEVSAKGSASGAASYGVYNLDVNPASSAGVENFGFAAMHSVLPFGIYLDRISAVKYLDFGCLGLNLTFMDFGAYSSIGLDENLYPVYTGSVTTPFSVYGSLVYARKFEGFSIGAAARLLDENLSGAAVYRAAFDAGFIIENLIIDDLNIGLSACNISNKDGDFYLPLDLKAAISYNIKNRLRDIVKITASADYLVYEQVVKGGAAFDYAVIDEFVIRGGFTAGNKQELEFSAGLTVKTGGTSFSYAYVPDSTAGDTHKFSISGVFGKEQESTEKPEAKGGESFGGYMQSGNYYYEAKQYRQAIKYYEYINLLYWKETEELKDGEKSAFFQKLGICYYNIRDNKHAKQYFERALYFDRENEILKHWIKSLK